MLRHVDRAIVAGKAGGALPMGLNSGTHQQNEAILVRPAEIGDRQSSTCGNSTYFVWK